MLGTYASQRELFYNAIGLLYQDFLRVENSEKYAFLMSTESSLIQNCFGKYIFDQIKQLQTF